MSLMRTVLEHNEKRNRLSTNDGRGYLPCGFEYVRAGFTFSCRRLLPLIRIDSVACAGQPVGTECLKSSAPHDSTNHPEPDLGLKTRPTKNAFGFPPSPKVDDLYEQVPPVDGDNWWPRLRWFWCRLTFGIIRRAAMGTNRLPLNGKPSCQEFNGAETLPHEEVNRRKTAAGLKKNETAQAEFGDLALRGIVTVNERQPQRSLEQTHSGNDILPSAVGFCNRHVMALEKARQNALSNEFLHHLPLAKDFSDRHLAGVSSRAVSELRNPLTRLRPGNRITEEL
jgi:hypothetical protein